MLEDKIPTVDEWEPVLLRALNEFCETLVECGESMRMNEGEKLSSAGVFIPCDQKTAEAVQEALQWRRKLGREHLNRMQKVRRLREMAAEIAVPRPSRLAQAHR